MKKLLILSGKGGTGKTTTAAAFIDFAKARAYADCDVDAPNLHLVKPQNCAPQTYEYMGSQKASINPQTCIGCNRCLNSCRFHAITQADGVCVVNEYACEGCGVCAYVCPQGAAALHDDIAGHVMAFTRNSVFVTAELVMGRGNSGKLVSDVKSRLYREAPDTDLAIIDGSPGIGCPVIASMSGADLVLVVAEPSVSGISDMERILKTAAVFQTKTAVCVNKYDQSADHTHKIKTFCADAGIPFTGCIPFDKQASAAINNGSSLAQVDCPASHALQQVFANTIQLL